MSEERPMPAETRGKARPLVAIVGRPNVGKSTLFNRLTGRHLAIVEDEPGVTRDRHYADAEVRGRPYVLVDTGGFEPETDDPVMAGVRDQVRLAVSEADVVLFVTDGTAELTEADHEALKMLRKASRPTVWIANKADSPSKAMEATDLYRSGAAKVIALSALHGRGMAELDAALESALAALPEPKESEEISEDVPRVAVVGRPNAGKSSLINRLLGADRLVVTEVPGTTTDAIDTVVTRNDRRYVFVDTAGVRRKRAVTAPVEMTSVLQAIRAIERCDVVVVLADIHGGVAEQDLRLVGLAMDRGRAILVGLNKVDTVDATTERKAVAAAHEQLKFATWIPVVKLSAKAGRGTSALLGMVDRAYESHNKRVGTAEVNRFFEEVVERHPPPTHAGRAVRIYYVTQVATRPPRFTMITNHPEYVAPSYKRYLSNQLRERFRFEAVPVHVSFRPKRTRKDTDGDE